MITEKDKTLTLGIERNADENPRRNVLLVNEKMSEEEGEPVMAAVMPVESTTAQKLTVFEIMLALNHGNHLQMDFNPELLSWLFPNTEPSQPTPSKT